MKVFLRLVRYVVGLAIFVAGALLVGVHVGAVLRAVPPDPEAAGLAAQALDLLTKALAGAPESPVWHIAPGLALAALGLLVARPPLTINLALRKPKEQKKSLRAIVHELTHPNDAVRLKAAKVLTKEARPSTIPALIKALLDKADGVRGQACEALNQMTGLTFDYVDIAPESVRKESVRQWLAWWQANKAAILAGADPKTVAGAASAGDEGGEGPAPDEATAVGRGTPVPRATPVPGSTPRPGSQRAVGRATPVPGGGVARQTPVPSGGRNLSVGELARRRRQRAATPLPGAMGALGGTDDTMEEPGGESEPPVEDAAPGSAPAGLRLEDAADAPGADAGIDAGAGDAGDLPPPDEDLPPPPE